MQGLRNKTDVFAETNVKVLDVIRARTKGLHAQLERTFDVSRSFSSRSSYIDLLETYLGIYRPFERLLANEYPSLASGRSRVALLESDLAVLGVTEREMSAVLECSPVLELCGQDCLLGAMYVLEGSSLGGQILYRQIEASLQITKDSGSSFFYGEGDRTGPVWRNFLYELEERVVSADRAAEGACAMFQVFESWLVKTAPGGSPCR